MNLINIMIFLSILITIIGIGNNIYSNINDNKNFGSNANNIGNNVNIIDLDNQIENNVDESIDMTTSTGSNIKVMSYKKRVNVINLGVYHGDGEIKFDKKVKVNYIIDINKLNIDPVNKEKIKMLYIDNITPNNNYNTLINGGTIIMNNLTNRLNINDYSNFSLADIFGKGEDIDTIKIRKDENQDIPISIIIFTSEPVYYEISGLKIQNIKVNKNGFGDNVNYYNSNLFNLY